MIKEIIFEGQKLVKIDTESMLDPNGAKGINQNYMLGRVVYNEKTKGASWGTVVSCYRKTEDSIAFRVKTISGNLVLWNVKSCSIAPEGFIIKDSTI